MQKKKTLLQVSDETLAQTTECEKSFSCLGGDRHDLCKIDYCVGDQVFFIECLNKGLCSYQKYFGDTRYCNCPTRKELYKKYKI